MCEEVPGRCRVETLEELLKRRRLRWFGHATRKGQEGPIRRILELKFTVRRHRARPKKSWRKIVETDMRLIGAFENFALNRAKWKKRISRQTL